MAEPSPSRKRAQRPSVKGQLRPSWKVSLMRLAVRMAGWELRGQLPPQFWRTTLVIWAPHRWQVHALAGMMPANVHLLESPISDAGARSAESLMQFKKGFTNLTPTHASPEELRLIVDAAAAAKSRITLCAWEGRRKFVHVHAPFKTSPFPDRDVHYMHRYFAYFVKTTD